MYVPIRKIKSTDYPWLALMFSILLFAFCASLVLEQKEKDELYEVSGVVESFEIESNSRRSGDKINLQITSNGEVRNLIQTDYSKPIPILTTLKKGDAISTLVSPDNLGRDIEWVWEIRRDGELLLSYEQTLKEKKPQNRRIGFFVALIAAIALLLLSVQLWIKNQA